MMVWNLFTRNRARGEITDSTTSAASGPAHQPERRAEHRDGSIAVSEHRLAVTDPVGEGRFPVLVPSPGVCILLQGVPLLEPTPVSNADQLDWQLESDAEQVFFRCQVAEDRMSATVEIRQDPIWFPDSVQVVGDVEVVLRPVASHRQRRRAEDPSAVVRAALQEMGVVYGLDEAELKGALERAGAGWRGTVVVAMGQEARAPVPETWQWQPPALGLAAPGQVVGRCQAGSPNLPCIDVGGNQQWIYPDAAPATVEIGEGLRRLPDGQVVATQRGLLRVMEIGDSQTRARIAGAKVIEGDVGPGAELDIQQDVVITGNLRKSRIRTTGAVVVAGQAVESDIIAAAVTVQGMAEGCKFGTVLPGHAAPLLGPLRVLSRQLADLAAGPADYEQPFRRAQGTLRALDDLYRSVRGLEPGLSTVMTQCVKVLLSSPDAVPPQRAASLKGEVDAFITGREGEVTTLGDVELSGGAARCQVWAGRDAAVSGKGLFASQVYAGRDICCGAPVVVAQSELTAARHVTVEGAAGQAGRGPVIRAGGRISLGEVSPGTTLEVGAQQYLFRAEMFRVKAHLSSRYELQIRQG